MAQVRVPILSFWLNRNILFAAAISAVSFSAGSATAQTVIIGGSGSAPVEVNMHALNPTMPYVSKPLSTRQARADKIQAQQDFSKSSRIVYGDEVINLIPPGSKSKKKVTVAKAPTAIQKKPVSKAAPKPKIKVAKLAPIKSGPQKIIASKGIEKPESVLKPKAEATKATLPKKSVKIATKAKQILPAPVIKPEPEKEIAVVSKPEITLKKSEPAKTTDTMQATKPKTVAKALAPSAPKSEDLKKPEKEMQVASIDPEKAKEPVATKAESAASKVGGENQIFFEAEQSKLPSSATKQLKDLANVLKSGNDRVQLVAFAEANSNSAARRLSLGRALVVRSKLMELGVPNNKIEVRALGKPSDGSPADRVDLKLIAR